MPFNENHYILCLFSHSEGFFNSRTIPRENNLNATLGTEKIFFQHPYAYFLSFCIKSFL